MNAKPELENLYSKVEDLKAEQERKLVEISGLSVEEAKAIIMDRIEQENVYGNRCIH